MKNTYVCTGGAGMIGSFLVDALLADPNTKQVRVIDNFSSGKLAHLAQHQQDLRLKIYHEDIAYEQGIESPRRFDGVDCVFHLAANPDARRGIENTRLDLELETIATYNVLEAMRLVGAKKIIFSSSGTVYGDSGLVVCREGFGERLPISLYGAGKVASEALISAFCGTFGMSAILFRFGNVVGERCTHGAIFDFINQLREHPDHLDVLGNGLQSKPYLYVKDVVAGMMHGLKLIDRTTDGFCQPFNLAPSGATSVAFIAEELVRQMGLTQTCQIGYGKTPAGWLGDVPHSRMSMAKLQATGFKLDRSSDEAVKYAIEKILKTI